LKDERDGGVQKNLVRGRDVTERTENIRDTIQRKEIEGKLDGVIWCSVCGEETRGKEPFSMTQ